MTISDVRKNVGSLVLLNGKGGISTALHQVVQKKVKLTIVKATANGDAVLEIPGKKDAGFVIVNPVGIDLAQKYNLQRS